MQFIKFNLFLLVLFFMCSISYGQNFYTDNECLNSSFDVEIQRKGSLFGLLPNKFIVEKDKCTISIQQVKWKYLKSKWIVDVCREPIHIKKEKMNGVDVFKRKVPCDLSIEDDIFCEEMVVVNEVFQDEGLIFAEGEKEVLRSDHGKIYCAFLLFSSYLKKGIVFSRRKLYENVLTPQTNVGTEIETPEKGKSEEKKEADKK